MNVISTLPIPLYDLGRARDLVEAVQPVERTREPASKEEQAQEPVARRPSARAVADVLDREALLDASSRARGQLQDDRLARQSQRALSAYNDVALEQNRDLLVEVLGVNEYA